MQTTVGRSVSTATMFRRAFSSATARPVATKQSRPFRKALIIGGAAVCGVSLAYNYQAAKTRDHLAQAGSLPMQDTPLAILLSSLPLRSMSRLWGQLNSIDLPVWARTPVYMAWTKAFGCNLDEMKGELTSYPNLGEFFARELKDGVRPLDPAPLVSPVDARLTVHGKVENNMIEQVKGYGYPANAFLNLPNVPSGNLHYCVLYLAPGDYHRIHSPTDFHLSKLTHVAGQLFPVAAFATTGVPQLFCRNERVVMNGSWQHGLFSLTNVGAYNVGSIALHKSIAENFDKHGEIITNSRQRNEGLFAAEATTSQMCAKGDEIAAFRLGSTVVLVFQVPEGSEFVFNQQTGDRVRMGQSLGTIVNATPTAP